VGENGLLLYRQGKHGKAPNPQPNDRTPGYLGEVSEQTHLTRRATADTQADGAIDERSAAHPAARSFTHARWIGSLCGQEAQFVQWHLPQNRIDLRSRKPPVL